MSFVKKLILATLTAGAMCSRILWAGDDVAVKKADLADAGLSWKTPDGVGYMVKADDPILAPSPTQANLPPAVKPDPAFVKDLLQVMDESLKYLSEKSTESDTQYYEKGIWHCKALSVPGGWPYGAGPAGMAAVLWKYRQEHPDELDSAAKAKQAWLRQVAIETFDLPIKEYQKPDGDFIDLASSHREFFTIDFVNTYLLLKETLDPDTRQRWLGAMRIQIDYMQKSGNYPHPELTGWEGTTWKATDGWYVNGNVELAKAEYIYLVWLATGEQKYKDLFELQWKHTLSPSPARWKGYGLFYLKRPTKADGSDGSAFVTEANNKPGFDGEYGMLQLSIAARLYAKSRDPRVLRLTNLLFNSLAPHLDGNTLLLDATYGSRHSVITQFITCAPEILVYLGGRSDLLPILPGHLDKAIKPVLVESARLNWGHPGVYRAYGIDLAAILEAVSRAESSK